MVALRNLLVGMRGTLAEWRQVQWHDLQFGEAWTALLVFVAILALSLLMVLARGLLSRQRGRGRVALPAILPMMRRSRLSGTRHAPFVLFLVGVPFFAVALADPHTAFMQEQRSFPGRRIAILIDGSSSMSLKFESKKLHTTDSRAYYTTIAAAEQFMRMRMSGPYHDLIALMEYGNYAYVITPFTTDYQNVLLSIRLISDPKNWGRFDDNGTTIMQGLEQGVELFKAFDFLDASGNLMVVFTDGRDDQITLNGRSLTDVVASARKTHIPIYMIRTAFNLKLGGVKQDQIWKTAVEGTGGRFYPAADEDSLLRAMSEIDKLSAGRINTTEYTVQRPRYTGFVLIAVLLWLTAAALKLGFPQFRTFP